MLIYLPALFKAIMACLSDWGLNRTLDDFSKKSFNSLENQVRGKVAKHLMASTLHRSDTQEQSLKSVFQKTEQSSF